MGEPIREEYWEIQLHPVEALDPLDFLSLPHGSAWLAFYLAAPERDRGHEWGRKQLQEFKVLTKGKSRSVLPVLLGHRRFSDAHRKMTRVKLSTIWTKFRIVL